MQRNLLLAGVLILAACSSSSTDQTSDPSPSDTMNQKASAPVDIEAINLTASSATLRLTFNQPAQGIALKVYGVDGLAVQGVPKIGDSYTRGQVADVPVTFVPGKGRSYLAAMVTGSFNGRVDSKAVSFSVGQPDVDQRAAEAAGVVTDAEGRRIRVVPAKRK